MRVVIQRVSHASVAIEGQRISSITQGLCLLVGIEQSDTLEDIEWMSKKITMMRIFEDEQQKMNLSVVDIGGEILSISQFTLLASTLKGNRPSFIKAARPEQAIKLYHTFNQMLEKGTNKAVKTGKFGAMMEISLLNSGPVTIVIDSKNRE